MVRHTDHPLRAAQEVTCIGLLYVTVADATAQKELEFKVKQTADGKIIVSVSPFLFCGFTALRAVLLCSAACNEETCADLTPVLRRPLSRHCNLGHGSRLTESPGLMARRGVRKSPLLAVPISNSGAS